MSRRGCRATGPAWHRRPQTLALVFAALALWAVPGAPATAAAQDVIAFANLNGDAVVVLDGRRSWLCWRDRILRTTGPLKLGATINSTRKCPSELNVFNAKAGMLLLLAPAWTHHPSNPLTVTLPAVRTASLRVVVVPGQVSQAQGWAQTALNEANTFLEDNRTGLRVAPGPIMTATDDQARTIGNGCETVGTLLQDGPAKGVYDANSLNVYFVPWIDAAGQNLWMGFNCYDDNESGVRAPNVLFVSLLYDVPSILGHELGHALGLRWLNAHTNPGAQDGRDEFPVTNLMYSYVDAATAAAQNRYSVGQAYRMNSDTASWLNRSAQQSAAPGVIKDCQPEPTLRVPCPRLSLDLPDP